MAAAAPTTNGICVLTAESAASAKLAPGAGYHLFILLVTCWSSCSIQSSLALHQSGDGHQPLTMHALLNPWSCRMKMQDTVIAYKVRLLFSRTHHSHFTFFFVSIRKKQMLWCLGFCVSLHLLEQQKECFFFLPPVYSTVDSTVRAGPLHSGVLVRISWP